MISKRYKILFSMIALMMPLCGYANPRIYGLWRGEIDLKVAKLEMSVRFFEKDGLCEATIDIVSQGAKNIPLEKVACEPGHVHFEIASPIARAFFDGKLDESDGKISGKFLQGNYEGTFSLTKIDEKLENEKVRAARGEHFTEEEISFTNDGITFAGTLALPKEKKEQLPAIVLITGSGPQDRNEEIMGFKVFESISDEMTRFGFAVLRYDDRGTGKTNGGNVNMATTADFARDVAEAVKFLKSRPEINPAKIGLWGHSEGGIVAPMVRKYHEDLAFMILMAGTGVKGGEIVVEQSKAMMLKSGMPAEQAEKISGFNASIFAALEKNDTDKAKQLLKEVLVYQFASMPDAVRDNYTSAEKYAEEMLEVQFRQLNAPWMRFFLRYDPQPALAELKMPVLLLFGENDLQVLPSQNKNVMEEALKKAGNQKFKSVLLPKANHLFEESETGEISDYGKKKVFVSGFFEAVKDFLKDFR